MITCRARIEPCAVRTPVSLQSIARLASNAWQPSPGRVAASAATKSAGWNWNCPASRSAAVTAKGRPASAVSSIGSPARAAAACSRSSEPAPSSVAA